jgi:alpha-mannosidase
MWLTLPAKMVQPGEEVHLKIVGAAENSNGWVMVFNAPDALMYFQEEVKNEGWLKLEVHPGTSDMLRITAPSAWEGKKVAFGISGKIIAQSSLKKSDKNTEIQVELPSIEDYEGKIGEVILDGHKQIRVPFFLQNGTEMMLQARSVINYRAILTDKNTWKADINIYYRPNLVKSLKSMSDSPLSEGEIYLMNSSHQDIAWMDSPEKCVIDRDTMLLTPLVNKALVDKNYRFDIEDVLMIREFIQRHPEQQSVIDHLLKEGRISVGASYIMPYEDMYSGESLIRQFYLGKRWLQTNFSGYNADTYWNVDVPGRTLQMPQILKKSGVKNMVISRQKTGFYNWYSPDGSFVRTFSPGHYGQAFPSLNKDFFDAAFFLADYSKNWILNFDVDNKPLIPVLSDWDMSPAKDYSSLINDWESLQSYTDEKGQLKPLNLSPVRLSLTPQLFARLPDHLSTGSIGGERPDVWLYIHGPSHQKALKASREADILLPAAEMFAGIESLLRGDFLQYPEEDLEKAWEAKIYPDHGWGGKHGDITDALFRRKYEESRLLAEKMVQNAIRGISAHINRQSDKGIPLMIFNDLSWRRTGPASFRISFKEGEAKSLKLRSPEGNEIPYQLANPVNYEDGSMKEVRVDFIASNVPSLGYKTYYLRPDKSNVARQSLAGFKDYSFETKFYKLTFGKGGLEKIYDKELGVDLIKPDNLKAGEVFFMKSVGNGAGEFADIQQPDFNILEQTGKYDADWIITENGPLFTTFTIQTKLEHAVVEQNIQVFKEIKKIIYNTRLLNWDGILFREFREAFPLNQPGGKVTYEVPFGVVRVGEDEMEGAAGERYTKACAEMHPRSILNWISSSNGQFGVTISSSVVAWDYVDNFNQTDHPVLQAILFASRQSCHGEGNDYLQTGNHEFSFSFTSHKPGWENGYKSGVEANHPFFVVVDPYQMVDAELPEELSFFSLDKENVMITAVKRSEDGNGLILRWYETEGKDTEMNLNSYFEIREAKAVNLIEEEEKEIFSNTRFLPFKTSKYSIETIKLILK